MRFVDDAFAESFVSTIGIDFKAKVLSVRNKKQKDTLKARLLIWDTAGQERFRTITMAYYRGAQGIIIVYDVTDERSFNNIPNWWRSVEQYGNSGVPCLLLGNKNESDALRVTNRAHCIV